IRRWTSAAAWQNTVDIALGGPLGPPGFHPYNTPRTTHNQQTNNQQTNNQQTCSREAHKKDPR
ncbi:MAG: hypothetical protein ABIO89_09210, partial [Cryobacterium sp.]